MVSKKQETQKMAPPYHFVPVNIENRKLTSEEESVLHHEFHPDGFTGSLLCELETHTAAIFGAYQYQVDDIDRLADDMSDALRSCLYEISGSASINKTIIKPAFYKERSLIFGSTIKGMLRHSISALTSVPMQRVQERTFSYRPNIGNTGNGKFKTYAAIITEEEPLKISLIENTFDNKHLIFVADDVVEKIKSASLSKGSMLRGIETKEKNGGHSTSLYINKEKKTILDRDYIIASYKGGIDSEGILYKEQAGARKKTYKHVLVEKTQYIENKTIIEIKPNVLNQYNKTTEHLVDDIKGHITPSHPNLPEDIHHLKNKIIENRRLGKGQVIFIELSPSREVTSFGNHYLYRWCYRDTIKTVNYHDRPQLKLINGESSYAYTKTNGEIKPSKLNIARSLFGFTDAEAGEKGAKKLSGRLSFNHALEVGTKVKDRNQWATLPITGSPKASAVEHYVKQNHKAKYMNTYGDTVDSKDSILSGRKFYLHHDGKPKNKDDKFIQWRDYINCPLPANLQSEHAPLAQNVTPAKTKYRFTVRFRNLRPWEIGLLLFSLDPEKYMDHELLSEFKEELQQITLGHKLGYARPLGFGSSKISVKEVNIAQGIDDYDHDFCMDCFFTELLDLSDKETIFQWLRVHRINTKKDFSYSPVPGNDSFDHHSKVRINHAKRRRGLNEDRSEHSYLPILS